MDACRVCAIYVVVRALVNPLEIGGGSRARIYRCWKVSQVVLLVLRTLRWKRRGTQRHLRETDGGGATLLGEILDRVLRVNLFEPFEEIKLRPRPAKRNSFLRRFSLHL